MDTPEPTTHRLLANSDGEFVGKFGFIVEIGEMCQAYVNMTVYEVQSDGYYLNNVWHDDIEKELYLTCCIKFDSCCHFTFGTEETDGGKTRQDGYIHLCGVHHIKKHMALMEELWRLAFKLMGRDAKECGEWDRVKLGKY